MISYFARRVGLTVSTTLVFSTGVATTAAAVGTEFNSGVSTSSISSSTVYVGMALSGAGVYCATRLFVPSNLYEAYCQSVVSILCESANIPTPKIGSANTAAAFQIHLDPCSARFSRVETSAVIGSSI